MKSEDKENKVEYLDSSMRPGEIVIGTLVSLDEIGRPIVDFSGNREAGALIAISTIEVHQSQVGRQVALLFANGNASSPVIMGLIHSPLASMLDMHVQNNTNSQQDLVTELEMASPTKLDDVSIDGRKITIEGKEEIVLKCGEASITLTKAGKILIRGKYLLNRSSGVNRIFGGSVQIN